MEPFGKNGERRSTLAVWFLGVSALMLTLGTVVTGLIQDKVPSALAAMLGTVFGYLAGVLAKDDGRD